MKLPTLLLAVSLTANAALLGLFAFRPALAPPAWRDFFTSDARRAADLAAENNAAHARTAAQAGAAAKKRAGVWATLQTDDLKALTARLRAGGFSPVLIRAIVSARLEATFSTRMTELLGSIPQSFWKAYPGSPYSNVKFYELQGQIYRDRARALRELLGDDAFAAGAGDASAEQRRKYGDLPKSRIDLVERIADDYAEMMAQVRAATQGIVLPEDREKLALLERERRADLTAVLSPAELEDYDMRNSTTTMRLRGPLTLMNATEEEYRTIYRTQQPYAELLYGGSTMVESGPEAGRKRSDAQQQMADDLRAALGEPRYAEYTRANDREYQNLYRAGQTANLSADAINRLYTLRTSVTEESMRIQETVSGGDARSAALQALVADTKARLIASLGSTLAENYGKNLSWLSALDRGYAVKLAPDGQAMSFASGPPGSLPKQ